MTTNNNGSIAWLLLIYTAPSNPSRLRAAIWRDLKKAGSIYLRDGVAVLPELPLTNALFRAIAAKIVEFGGEAALVEGAKLDEQNSTRLVAWLCDERDGEYADIEREAGRLLAHITNERSHREFSVAERTSLDADLGKLRRWAQQVRARDYFMTANGPVVAGVLDRVEASLSGLLAEARR